MWLGLFTLFIGILALLVCRNASRPISRPIIISPITALVAAPISEFPKLWFASISIVAGVLFSLGAASGFLGIVGLVLIALAASQTLPHVEAVNKVEQVISKVLAKHHLKLREPDEYYKVKHHHDIAYHNQSHRQKLDVWQPITPKLSRPALLYIHGGGWTLGSKRLQGKVLCQQMAKRGWVVLSMNYQLVPKAHHPDQLIDTKRAISWFRSHAQSFGADPNFLVVAGGSAGGHLATMAALTSHDLTFQPGFENVNTSVNACVSLYGVYDLTKQSTKGIELLAQLLLAKSNKRDPSSFQAASPIHLVHEQTPAMFVIHGAIDNLVPAAMAKRFAAKCERYSKEDVIHCELPLAHHGFDQFAGKRSKVVSRAIFSFAESQYQKYCRESAGITKI